MQNKHSNSSYHVDDVEGCADVIVLQLLANYKLLAGVDETHVGAVIVNLRLCDCVFL